MLILGNSEKKHFHKIIREVVKVSKELLFHNSIKNLFMVTIHTRPRDRC